VGLDEEGVTYRINFTGSASDFLRGDGTWGPDPGDWKLLGNAGTDPSVNYLGTADATQFHIRTNEYGAHAVFRGWADPYRDDYSP
jgi:trimeric autotransporter adhesin